MVLALALEFLDLLFQVLTVVSELGYGGIIVVSELEELIFRDQALSHNGSFLFCFVS